MKEDYYDELDNLEEDEYYYEPTEEEKELIEIDKEQSTQVRKGQVEFKNVNHSERAVKFGRVSDGDTTKYINIALEYFGHRCALSGERFQAFDKKVDGKKSNLSAEHVVALCLGGDDIVPNIVPSVLQYNLRKNGYYLLDYWNKQKDAEGKSLYSPYRLLKLVNYMMKSIEARDLKTVKEYRKAIMTPNEIDELLAEIDKQDELEPDNSKKKIYSDTITATTVDEDNKKILTEVPQVEGNIPTQREQQEKFRQNEIDMMDIFLSDAVGLLNRTQELQQIRLKDKDGKEISLQDKLDDMLKSTIGVIPFEVEVRNVILEKIEAIGIQDNKYSVANDLLNNTEILEKAKENREDVKTIVGAYIENQLSRIKESQILSEEQVKTVISNMPTILYNENEMGKIKLWSTYRSESFEKLISGNYAATDKIVDALIILKKNGINLVYEDERGRIVNTIKQGDTIENMLERYPNLTKEEKEKIQGELEELGINPNIGRSLMHQKSDRNKEKFEKALRELKTKLQQEGIEIIEEEWKNLIERQVSQNPTEDMVNVIEVLKRNGINLVYEDEKGKIVNTIQREDTIEKILERYPNLTKEEKEKIQGELEELGINPNIGMSLMNRKKDRNKEEFEKALIELKTKLQQEGIEITEDEWNCLIERKQISQTPTEDMVNAIEVLKRNGINLVYEDEKGKIVKTIKYTDTIEKMLERYPNLTKEEKEKIQGELEELGINTNIGISLRNRKKDRNKEEFEKALIELKTKLQQEGIEITEDEWNCLIEKKQKSQNPTEDMVNAIEVLKRNGINLVYEDEKGKIVNTIKARDTIEKMLERYPNLTKEEKEKIQGELEEQGINPNIGIFLNNQTRNKEKFEKALIELRVKLQQEGIEITEDELNFLIEKRQISQNPTEDMVNAIEVLKRNGINLVYEDEKGKIVNTIKQGDTIEKILERYPNLTKEEKEKIQGELEELGINPNIGRSLMHQKSDRNKEKFEKALIELRVKLQQEGIEITEEEWKLLTQKSTKKKVKEAVVEQKNKGELGQNQQIEDEVFEETIRQAEQTLESEVAGR